jgi:hypothetical protein
MDTASLANRTITGILTPLCESVHPAWINEHTTPIATSAAVLQLDNGELVMVVPCEVQLEAETYPALDLSVQECDPSELQWMRDGKTYSMSPLGASASSLPFLITRVSESDPLDEGPVSEILLFADNGSRLLFRHIMPPMTLGIDVAQAS